MARGDDEAPIVASSGGEVFLASLDKMGGYRWPKTLGSGPLSASLGALGLDSSSRVLFAGGIGGTVDFGCGSATTTAAEDVFVAEFNQ